MLAEQRIGTGIGTGMEATMLPTSGQTDTAIDYAPRAGTAAEMRKVRQSAWERSRLSDAADGLSSGSAVRR